MADTGHTPEHRVSPDVVVKRNDLVRGVPENGYISWIFYAQVRMKTEIKMTDNKLDFIFPGWRQAFVIVHPVGFYIPVIPVIRLPGVIPFKNAPEGFTPGFLNMQKHPFGIGH
jgi:hypothetical protein